MEHCKNGHKVVYYHFEGSGERGCPECWLKKVIDDLERKLYDLNTYADNLKLKYRGWEVG